MNLTTKDTNSELPKLTLSQDYDHRKQIDSNEDSKPQPLESYGPSLPPGKLLMSNNNTIVTPFFF